MTVGIEIGYSLMNNGGGLSAQWRPANLAASAALALLLCCYGESGGLAAPAPAPVEVGVTTIQPRAVPLIAELPGRVAAFRMAQVRPQVNGIIQKRLFVEGNEVKAGQQLYQIDPATYEAALASAKATLARAEAAATLARQNVGRYSVLIKKDTVSQQTYDDAVATLAKAEADVAAGKAAVRSAEIELAYTRVYAPIDGITGRSNYTEGALVTANQSDALTTVTQLDPVYVDVTQPSNVLLRLKREYASGQITTAGDNQARVTLIFDDDTEYAEKGRLQFSEVTVDQGTGSVTLRAIVPNTDRLLMPGMFVRERIELGIREDAILVSQRAVTRDQRGRAVVMVVDPSDKVESRVIEVGRTIGDDWLVRSGLQQGDRVIVAGLQKVRPGAQVTTVQVDSANPRANVASQPGPEKAAAD